ncbi:neutral zinc metallopeptidase [Atopobiaceae bacterium P1]|nr:neutral zinc metallopeptidase [Atopobiaceae bacterium P1]
MPYFYMGYNGSYFLLVIVSLVLGGLTQWYINSTYRKWSRVPLGTSRTGADVARAMLAANGVDGVGIEPVPGELTDHFDPRDNSLHLSPAYFQGSSVASVAVACHEAGHAVQFDKGYVPGRIRTALVPVVNFASNVWMIVFIIGISMAMSGLINLAIILFAASVLFQLVTLPVEFDASRRALSYISQAGFSQEVVTGSRQVLFAAALTYVAAALVSCLQLLYLLGQTNNRD